jgi:hypothetical protein
MITPNNMIVDDSDILMIGMQDYNTMTCGILYYTPGDASISFEEASFESESCAVLTLNYQVDHYLYGGYLSSSSAFYPFISTSTISASYTYGPGDYSNYYFTKVIYDDLLNYFHVCADFNTTSSEKSVLILLVDRLTLEPINKYIATETGLSL